jgi:general secretion pathway protein G
MPDRHESARTANGFTLVEVMVVIVILGMLAGIVAFAMTNSTSNAAANACKVEAQSFQNAVNAAPANKPAVALDGNKPQTDAVTLNGAGLLSSANLRYLSNAAGGQAVEPGTYPTGWKYAGRVVNAGSCA